MTGDQLLKLYKAGFDMEQIVKIDETLGLTGEPEQKQEPEPEPKSEPENTKQAADEIAKATEQLSGVLEKILKANIIGKEQPASEVESTDDILASIIQGSKPGKEA